MLVQLVGGFQLQTNDPNPGFVVLLIESKVVQMFWRVVGADSFWR